MTESTSKVAPEEAAAASLLSAAPRGDVADTAPSPAVASNDAAAQAMAFSRVTRRASWFVVALGVLTFALVAVPRLFAPIDLASGKRWRASSTLEECHPERVDCGGVRTSIFFHTREQEQPWVEIDLGAPTTFSSVTVRNRSDGWQDRAVPLVLEVGDDRQTWRELARRQEVFGEWSPSFEEVTARYVRLRAAKKTFLHLEAVTVQP